ncbi:MAG: dihydroorotate dehydrogenase electron transfer subunit [Candidatus Thorarchaeota archaeon]|nr:dihydroorotate dehydrogenase electron transfer subunit [Candidatus Thorarchaeota archaeon]
MNIESLTGGPRSVQIVNIVKENAHDRTIFFKDPDMTFSPGQFLMVWVSKVDEIPLSISYFQDGLVGLTIRPIGSATKAIVSLAHNDLIGIRGPFGHPFDLDCPSPLIVGGGIGTAPLRPVIQHFVELGTEITVVIGARTKDELLFIEEMQQLEGDGVRLIITTDDGSAGMKGFVTMAVAQVLSESDIHTLYTCGPEPMMVALWRMAMDHDIRFQASLERYMKCGCGLCGTCALDPTGELVCVDGPVFSGEQLRNITEFGNYHRDSTGVKQNF